MKYREYIKLNIFITACLFAMIVAAFAVMSFASSSLDASAQIDSSDGAILRKGA